MAAAANRGETPPSPSPSQLPPVPLSPTYSYASTANPTLSQYNLPLPPPPRTGAHAVLTKADLEHSQQAYADLISTAKSYRLALASLSTAASSFGSALESCARLKEARADALGPAAGGASLSNSFNTKGSCTADTLLTVAGLQHLVANHHHILSETVYRSFEVPLLHEMDKWRATMEDEEEGYTRAVAAQSREINRLEKEGMKLQRQKRRDVGKFREHLVELTTKLDGLTTLHGEHARSLLRESQETSVRIVDASCSLVRAEMEIFESLARKGWTGGGLEDVLEKGVDLFAPNDEASPPSGVVGYGKGGGDTGGAQQQQAGSGGEGSNKLFSILPPKSILADSGSDTVRIARHNRTDSLLMDADRYQSLAGAVVSRDRVRDHDADSVFSEFNRSRGVRPFSPQPQRISLNPEDLILGGLEDHESADENTTLLVLAGSSSTKQHRLHHERRASDTTTEQDEQEEGCAVYDEEDDENDEEAHPWRNEHGQSLQQRRMRQSTSTSSRKQLEQQHIMMELQQSEQQPYRQEEDAREGSSSWIGLVAQEDDHDSGNGDGKLTVNI
ncbi:hypothetical protein QBC37DRAFT_443089 [Rhypophila decipiens]|uniref:Protein IVY1 n=1 Tax=Rhypophila decipiens TaxID=261697 RepID=A0AAN6Y067_9PEZI|nr:hypothetical protein QBC37DRAFT_443089 [Rhypophila decipiens]